MSALWYSIGLNDHLHNSMVHFHNLGLWGSDVVNSRNWTLNKLSTIRSKLRHKEVTQFIQLDAQFIFRHLMVILLYLPCRQFIENRVLNFVLRCTKRFACLHFLMPTV